MIRSTSNEVRYAVTTIAKVTHVIAVISKAISDSLVIRVSSLAVVHLAFKAGVFASCPHTGQKFTGDEYSPLDTQNVPSSSSYTLS